MSERRCHQCGSWAIKVEPDGEEWTARCLEETCSAQTWGATKALAVGYLTRPLMPPAELDRLSLEHAGEVVAAAREHRKPDRGLGTRLLAGARLYRHFG